MLVAKLDQEAGDDTPQHEQRGCLAGAPGILLNNAQMA
jgi:hypothetical protein